ncbi:hypothetical protein [Bdellovibrio svalbardensis]|uniref:Uncharacterized protein n=1 Tax=Bdellovibrio svalbardensis TaxID=2972972 RepID=A0ABT6DDK2_9BACT|nr:hypothetical protein [Bdellovibrio svalbardensis]MDG0814919.1 hypothetical protein [Bdellovibrio svalbardensis]
MKALLAAMTLVFASPVFANCVSEMMATTTHGDRDAAARLCSHSQAVCNLSQIIATHNGMNYSQAIELCVRNLKSNADVIECVSKGYNYSECQH